ncbi:mannose binding [Homalodisca vitripennis]|nr:mannose binding [Homalodisca vitripennis]
MCGDSANCWVQNHIPWCNCKDVPKDELCVDCHKRKKTFHPFTDEQANWYQALANCFSRGMRLATIQDQQEYDDLIRILKNYELREDTRGSNFWLSGADLAETGNYLWMSTGRPMSFSQWWWFEPNHVKCDGEVKEHCVEISWDLFYTMNDLCCSIPQWYVCEEV